VLAGACSNPEPGPGRVTDFGPNPGNLRMWMYVPARIAPRAPLVVTLHGCTQTAAQYVREAGWIELADRYGFIVLAPEQKDGWWGNNPRGCFNWFYTQDQSRGTGEPASIMQMISRAQQSLSVDTGRIFITGLSAGGAMAANMLAAYPEVFAGGAIIAGIPHACSRVPRYVPLWVLPFGADLLYTSPFRCLRPGRDLSPQQWGARVRATAPRGTDHWPTLSIWQGTADAVVATRNATELVEQWTNVHGIGIEPAAHQRTKNYTRYEFRDAQGKTRVEEYLINNMGHGVAVDPPGRMPRPDQCGATGDFALAAGVCASYQIARFWGIAVP